MTEVVNSQGQKGTRFLRRGRGRKSKRRKRYGGERAGSLSSKFRQKKEIEKRQNARRTCRLTTNLKVEHAGVCCDRCAFCERIIRGENGHLMRRIH